VKRAIKHIVLHCTATSKDTKVSSIVRYWKERKGWINPGYHFIIDVFGNVTQLQPLDKASNGVRGHNSTSINISYIGGVDKNGKSKDTRTMQQYDAMVGLVKAFHAVFPDADILGHRDFEGVKKSCPSFDVKQFLKEIKI